MSAQRIDPVLVEKAAKAAWNADDVREKALAPNPWEEQDEELKAEYRESSEAAIRAVDKARRLKEERRVIDYEHVRVGDAAIPIEESRLVSDWRPVEQGDTDGD